MVVIGGGGGSFACLWPPLVLSSLLSFRLFPSDPALTLSLSPCRFIASLIPLADRWLCSQCIYDILLPDTHTSAALFQGF